MARVEDIAPDEIGENLIYVTLAQDGALLRAHQPIVLAIDYSEADKRGGVVMPIEITVSSGSSSSSWRKVSYRRVRPTVFAFTPVEGGPHLVRVREKYHNRWFGTLTLDVDGERLSPTTLG